MICVDGDICQEWWISTVQTIGLSIGVKRVFGRGPLAKA